MPKSSSDATEETVLNKVSLISFYLRVSGETIHQGSRGISLDLLGN